MELPDDLLQIIRVYSRPTGRVAWKRQESEQIHLYHRELIRNQLIVGGPEVTSFYELWVNYKNYDFLE